MGHGLEGKKTADTAHAATSARTLGMALGDLQQLLRGTGRHNDLCGVKEKLNFHGVERENYPTILDTVEQSGVQ